MIQASRKKSNVLDTMILSISAVLILELLYQPNVEHLKSIGGLPVFKVLGFTLLGSEMLVFIFIGMGALYAMEKVRRSGRVYLGPNAYSPLPVILVCLICASCIIGFRNQGFLVMFRKVLLPGVFFIVYMNAGILPRTEKICFGIVITGFIALTVLSLTYSMGLGSLTCIIWKQPFVVFDLRQVIVLTVLALDVAMAKLLFSRFSLKWLAVFVLCAMNLFYHVTIKSAVVAFIISAVIMVFIKGKDSRFGKMKAMLFVLGCVALFWGMFTYATEFLPQKMHYEITFKNQVARQVAWRYFKADINSTEEFDIKKAIFSPEADISSTRFAIWQIYFREALKGFGIAPYGFGCDGIRGLRINEDGYVQGAHNLIMYFALNCGLLSALILVALILRYVYLNIIVLARLKPGTYGEFMRAELIALYTFSVSVIFLTMFEGSIHNIHVAWTFWFSVAVLLKRYNILNKVHINNMMDRKNSPPAQDMVKTLSLNEV